MYCSNENCRKWNEDKAKFCKYCGAKLISVEKTQNVNNDLWEEEDTTAVVNRMYQKENENKEHQYDWETQTEVKDNSLYETKEEKREEASKERMPFDVNEIPNEYKPIGMWGYFGYEILFMIPLIGIICLICFALCASNRNLKNFARAHFCTTIISLILVVISVCALYGDVVYYYLLPILG